MSNRVEPWLCATPEYHKTHQYCPNCTYMEGPGFLEAALTNEQQQQNG